MIPLLLFALYHGKNINIDHCTSSVLRGNLLLFRSTIPAFLFELLLLRVSPRVCYFDMVLNRSGNCVLHDVQSRVETINSHYI